MFNANNPVSIFVPVLVIVALTVIAFVRMAAARAAAVKAGQDPNFYKAGLGTPEPEATAVAVRHYGNLLELPTVFYAACLTAFVLGSVTFWSLVFAWGYAVMRILQSVVHLTSNHTGHRGLAFVVGMVFVIALWVNLALVICAKL